MRKNFRYLMLLTAVIVALVTPTPNARTMLIFLASMIALYFLWLAVTRYRRLERLY